MTLRSTSNLLAQAAPIGGPLVTVIGVQIWCVVELRNLKKIVTNGLTAQVKSTGEKVSRIEGYLEAKDKHDES